MANLNTIITVPAAQTALFSALFSRNAVTNAFDGLKSLRSTSKELYQILNDEFIVKLFSNKAFAALNARFQHLKINYLIINNYWSNFEAFIELVARHNGAYRCREMVKKHLLYAVKVGSTDFVAKLLAIRIQNSTVQFPAKNLIRAFEYALNAKKNDTAITLLSFLQPRLNESDPEHFSKLENALRNNEEFNLNGDVFYQIKKLNSSRILLELLTAPKKKIVIPEGDLYTCLKIPENRTSIYFAEIWGHSYYQFNKLRYYSSALMWLIGTEFKNSYNISYYDNKAIKHEFEIPKQNGVYTHEGVSTSNLYELIVKTSMGSEFLRTFPHQFVAVTDQALEQPLEDQPWYFGNITNEEAREILIGAASNSFFLTLSRGLQFFVCWSEPKRSGQTQFLSLPFNGCQELKKLIEKAMDKFSCVLGFYNGGSPKNIEVLKFHRILAESDPDLERSKHWVIENKIRIPLQDPSPLWTYLHSRKIEDASSDGVLKWLIGEGVRLDGSETPSIMALSIKNAGVEYAKYLLSFGVKCDTSALLELVAAIPHCDEFKIFWEARKSDVDLSEILGKLLAHAELYNSRWGNGEKRKLLMLAWKFGNDDNLFKLLPKEILQLIFQYDIDVPHWYTIGEIILAETPQRKVVANLVSIDSMLFIAKYRNSFYEKVITDSLSRLCGLPNYFQDKKLPQLFRKLRQMDPSMVFAYKPYTFPGIVRYCTSSTDVDLLSAILETKIIDTQYFLEQNPVPMTWLACKEKNKPAIEVLTKYGLIQLDFNFLHYTPPTLQEWLISHQVHDIYEYVVQCIEKNKRL